MLEHRNAFFPSMLNTRKSQFKPDTYTFHEERRPSLWIVTVPLAVMSQNLKTFQAPSRSD